MSVHDLGAGELLGALHLMEAWPRRVRVIGLEPKAIELGVDLTPGGSRRAASSRRWSHTSLRGRVTT